ncbi:histidinol-phosphate aminotransferase, partial [human gut metagenome]
KLKEQGIYVRYWDKPRISNHLRISIGTKENMDKVFEKLAEIVG